MPHIDPWMSLLLPALLYFGSHGQYTFGGAKPVPVNSRKFRNFRRGDIIVSAAGVTTNLFLAVAFAVLFVLVGVVARTIPAGHGVFDTVQRMMVFGIWLNLLLCFFNLIPIPPLDGSHLLYHALPPRAGAWYRESRSLRIPAAVRSDVPVPAGAGVPAHAGARGPGVFCSG